MSNDLVSKVATGQVLKNMIIIFNFGSTGGVLAIMLLVNFQQVQTSREFTITKFESKLSIFC